MGTANSTLRDGLSVPTLARLCGFTHSRLYQLIRSGKGPQLTPIERSPYSDSHKKPESYVRWDDALTWLQERADAPWMWSRRERYLLALRKVRVERAHAAICNRQLSNFKAKRKYEAAGGIPTASFATGGLEP
jgi:hypothetical protein